MTTIAEVMTKNPETLPTTATVADAARLMRDKDIGDVIVMENGTVCGIVTDRDIVIRAVAENGTSPSEKTLGDICSKDLETLSPDSSVEEAVQTMRNKAVRRLPVIDGGKAVGIVSIGDLAEERDPKSALADISAAPANN